MSRPTWDDVWMGMAELVSQRSLCMRAQVGAVIVTTDQRVASVSYSGPSPAFVHCGKTCDHWCERYKTGDKSPGYALTCTTHAEINGLLRADRRDLDGATIYITGSVCSDCARAIAQTGIKRVVHKVDETMAHRKPEVVEGFLSDRGVLVERR